MTKGLLTVNKFLEKFTKELINDKNLEQFSEIQRKKQYIEMKFLEGDLTDPHLLHYQASVSRGEETKILQNLIILEPYVHKLLHLLKKISHEERYQPHHKQIVHLIKFIQIGFTKLPQLKKYARKQANALHLNRFKKFIKQYEKEKQETTHILEEFVALGGEEEIIQQLRALEKNEKDDLRKQIYLTGFYITLTSMLLYITINADPKLLNQIITGGMVFSAGITEYHLLNLISILHKQGGIKKLLTNQKEKKERYKEELKKDTKNGVNQKTIRKIREIEKRYDIIIQGSYTNKDINHLEQGLKLYYPQEVKLFLETVTYVNKPINSSENINTLGHINYKTKHITLSSGEKTSIIDHELAHGRTKHLPNTLIHKWKQINTINYETAKQLRKNNVEWKNKNDIYYGYYKAYGSINIQEDIATATETILKYSRKNKQLSKINKYYYLKKDAYTEIYLNKARLLYQYGFIQHEDYNQIRLFLKKEIYKQANFS